MRIHRNFTSTIGGGQSDPLIRRSKNTNPETDNHNQALSWGSAPDAIYLVALFEGVCGP